MKTNYKKSFLGSILAFVLGTSCCWLTSLAVWLGGATFLTILSSFVQAYKPVILGAAVLFLGIGIYQFWKHKQQKGKKFFTIIFCVLFSNIVAFAQNTYDPKNLIIGKWRTDDNRAIIEIFESNSRYFGKIVWLQMANDQQGNARKDIKNQDKTKQNANVLGLTVMNNFVFQGNAFVNGTIYDPDSGGSYNCKLWLDNENTLKVRDYCGIFYKTFTWKKEK